MDLHYDTLLEKLIKLTPETSIELTNQEAALYGVEYADKLPIEDYQQEVNHE